MEPEHFVADTVEVGNDIISLKMYAISAATLWGYDYLLTLEDEVEYAWKTRNASGKVFALFLIMRYLPGPFFTWVIISSWSPAYTAELCQQTVFLQVGYFVLITLIAHTVLTLRVYAITGKNKWFVGGLYGLTIFQLGVGVYLCVYASLHHWDFPQLDLDAYRGCIFQISTFGSLLYTSFSLTFDLGAFLIVLKQTRAIRSQSCRSNDAIILNTVTRDTAIYFLVIFTSHFLVIFTMTCMRPVLRLLPMVGNGVFVPMMITRIILSLKGAASLKKAARPQQEFEMVGVLNRPPTV